MGTEAFGATEIDKNAQREFEGEQPLESAVVRRTDLGVNQVEGEVDGSDLKLARLEIAYGVGKFVEKGIPQGTLVLDGLHSLVTLGTPLIVTVIHAVKYYKTWMTKALWDAQVKPTSYATAAEVIAAGGTLDWSNGEDGRRVPPTIGDAMDLTLLIEKPEKVDCGLFTMELGGKLYTPAILTVDKMAYQSVGPAVLRAAALDLKARGITSGRFKLVTVVVKKGTNTLIKPVLSLMGQHDQAFLGALSAFLAGKAITPPAEASAVVDEPGANG